MLETDLQRHTSKIQGLILVSLHPYIASALRYDNFAFLLNLLFLEHGTQTRDLWCLQRALRSIVA